MTTHLYRGAVLGRGVFWTARCVTHLGTHLTLYGVSPAALVRLLRGDPWCQCITKVLTLKEVHEGEQEGHRAVA